MTCNFQGRKTRQGTVENINKKLSVISFNYSARTARKTLWIQFQKFLRKEEKIETKREKQLSRKWLENEYFYV